MICRLCLMIASCLVGSGLALAQDGPVKAGDQPGLEELRKQVRELESQNVELRGQVERLFQMVEALSASAAGAEPNEMRDADKAEPNDATPRAAAPRDAKRGDTDTDDASEDGPLLRFEEVGKITAPGNLVQMLVSDADALMFTRNAGSRIWVIDLKSGRVKSEHAPTQTFSDISLSPDGRFLYAADFGGERVGYKTPVHPHHVHRYSVADGKWESRGVSGIAWRIKAVEHDRFLLHSQDQWLTLTLNQWDARGVGISQIASVRWGSRGDLVYDPRTRRALHGNSGSSSREVMAMRVEGDELIAAESSGTYGSARDGGGSYALSADGRHFFYGSLMFGTLDLTKPLRKFPDAIVAAGSHLAFDKSGNYYEISTGAKFGTLPQETSAFAWSADGRQMWCFQLEDQTIRHYRLLPGEP